MEAEKQELLKKLTQLDYKQVYFRIDSPYKWGIGWTESQEEHDLFEEQVKDIIGKINMKIGERTNSNSCLEGIAPETDEYLYFHPMSFSGVLSPTKLYNARLIIDDYPGKRWSVRAIDVYQLKEHHIDSIIMRKKETMNEILKLKQ